jgi:prepilin-type N-terminal cleavage/methylation domain-containing protein
VSNLLKKEKGFTLIEIVLVLAIAGLLLVIVFLAVSGAQKSRRDTQRKNDLSRIAAQLESYASNTNGNYPNGPAPAVTWAAFTGLTYITAANLNDPTTGAAYTYAPGNALVACTPANVGTVSYNLVARTYDVRMCLENGQSDRTNQ